MTSYISRLAARVLVRDSAGRVLLFHGRDPARPDHAYWFTPGGGVEPGETLVSAAVRELAEETGLVVAPGALGEPVWHESTEFPYDGRWYRQEQDYFLLRVESWEVDTAGFTEVERAGVDGHRWWPPGELATTTERYYPAGLPDLLARVDGGESRC